MPALQRKAAWAEETLLGDLRQSVPQNGCVHLHIIDTFQTRAHYGPLPLQSPGPFTEPQSPETPKVHFKVRTMPIWTLPGKKAQKSIKNVEKALFGNQMSKTGFWTFLLTLGPSFGGGGSRWHFSDFKMHFWGFGVPGLCRGTGRLQRYRCRPELSERFGSHWSNSISRDIRLDQWPLCIVRQIRMAQ